MGRGLTPQLFLFVVLPLTILLIVMAFGSLVLHSRAMRSLVAEREARTVHAAADAIELQLLHRASTVRGLSLLADRVDPPAAALEQAGYLERDFEGGLAVVSETGEVLASRGEALEWGSLPISELLARSRESGSPEFSGTFVLPGRGQRGVLVGFSGELRSVVGVFFPASLAARVLDDAFQPGSPARAWMLDTDRTVLYPESSSSQGGGPADSGGVDRALAGEPGVSFAEVDGQEYVVASTTVSATGWAVLLEEAWEAVDNPLLRQTQAAPLVLIPALLLSLVAVGFAIRSVVQPLRRLESKAAAVRAGDLRALEEPVGGIAEIESLQRTLAQMGQRLRTYQQSLRRYAGAVIHSQEDERRRVARELHDETIQALIALDQRTQLAQRSLAHDPAAATEHLHGLRRQAEELMQGVRRVVRALRPIYLEDLGLPTALEMLAKDAAAASGTEVGWALFGEPRRLFPQQEIALYRIAQEALTNAGRHAGAATIRLGLRFEPGRVVLRVEDDGIGFTPTADIETSDHYGLTGMKERAELIGANWDLASSPGQGTSVLVELTS